MVSKWREGNGSREKREGKRCEHLITERKSSRTFTSGSNHLRRSLLSFLKLVHLLLRFTSGNGVFIKAFDLVGKSRLWDGGHSKFDSSKIIDKKNTDFSATGASEQTDMPRASPLVSSY